MTTVPLEKMAYTQVVANALIQFAKWIGSKIGIGRWCIELKF